MSDTMTGPQGQRERDVPGQCVGELCGICGQQAMAKVEEVIFGCDPIQMRHPLTQYLCADHASMVLQPYRHREGGCPFCEHTGVHPRFLSGRHTPTQEEGEGELVERVGRAIYDAMRAGDPEGQRHPWVPRGNSLKQTEAREMARIALGPAVPTPPSADKSYTATAIREMVERVRNAAAATFRGIYAGHESVESAAVNAAIDALLAQLEAPHE